MAKDDEILEELRRIRTLLEPKPAPPAPPPKKGLWNEFMDFLSKYRVMGLAVAFIIGVYLGGLVNALVKDLILPIIGLVIPGLGDLATYEITFAQQIFRVGDFLAALITFIIVAFVIFLIVKVSKKWGIE
ncbi:MAG: MscL family protein [Candidatus Bathyarchaeota archaeon]|nr:MscL family protein [Candidatus Bathyarchaeota archaeon]